MPASTEPTRVNKVPSPVKDRSAPLSAPVNATASRRPAADVDRRGPRALAMPVRSEANVVLPSLQGERLAPLSPATATRPTLSAGHPNVRFGRKPPFEAGSRAD